MRNIKSFIIFVAFFFLSLSSAIAQIYDPVKWTVKLSKIQNGKATITYEASIKKGWHIYSTKQLENGPVATSFAFTETEGVKILSEINPRTKLVEEYEPTFAMTLGWYEDKATFQQQIQVENPSNFTLKGYITYMCCSKETCTPPTNSEFDLSRHSSDVSSNEDENAELQSFSSNDIFKFSPVDIKPVSVTMNSDSVDTQRVSSENVVDRADTWANVELQMKEFEDTTDKSLIMTFLMGLLGGFIAVITPCVWPIIPMTVSFFLKRGNDPKKGKKAAIVYGLSIICIYVTLGLVVTAIFGASKLNELSSNAAFNVFLFVLLVLFAVSFFGGFEIALPATWSTKLDQKVDKSAGLVSILFMAFTLVIVSFSCTGPIIGTLLVDVSSNSNILSPAIGMLGFAIALAIPFTLFAFFPSWLKNLPRSGGWLNSVKVLLGFFELAFALKFLSNADLVEHWRILDREVFIVLWVVIFSMAGMYLLGKIHFAGDDQIDEVSVPRFFLSIASFAFALYLVPGLWGAPLKAASAFIPPISTQDFTLYKGKISAKFKDYDEALKYAASIGKPVAVDFTGHACVNCREMESAVWTDPRVRSVLKEDYVLVSLYTDDRQTLEQPMKVFENGKESVKYTVGEKWSFLEKSKFGANAQPFYVLLDSDGTPLNKSCGYTKNSSEFLNFLKTGLKNFKERQENAKVFE